MLAPCQIKLDIEGLWGGGSPAPSYPNCLVNSNKIHLILGPQSSCLRCEKVQLVRMARQHLSSAGMLGWACC